MVVRAGSHAQQARDVLQGAGLKPPFVAKPLWADGREGAHGLAVLADEEGVEQLLRGDTPAGLEGPLLLSQFVNHGGCLFKVLASFQMGKALCMSCPRCC